MFWRPKGRLLKKVAIDLRLWRIVAFGVQCPFDHAQYTASDHPTPVVVSYRRQAFARQDKIERRYEISINVPSRSKTMVSMIPS
jgi:hypothetical protein